ncbi:hypothetical protein FACS189427_01660 [Planctomycetales bacterium]|nr:hypothetical protein FACS189427_01660 [Planctomycetales bacterium]
MEGSIRVNNHGARSNGDVFSGANEPTDFNLNQLWLNVEREMDASRGFDWGAKAAFCFGMDGPNIAKWHDQSFDYKWGSGDYGLATNNLKVLLGYKKLSVEAGIIGTLTGLEGTETWDNFFMSGALVNSMMPTSHLGFLAHYELSDRLTLSGGLTNGFDNGGNRFHDKAFLGGFEFQLTEKTNVTYAVIVGSTHDGILPDGTDRYGDGRTQGYLHTLDFCWNVTKNFDWIVEWMLADNTCVNAGVRNHLTGYGVNTHLIYTLSDKLSIGTRFDWLHDSVNTDSSYHEVSFGLNYLPVKNIKIRPELRYDWVNGTAKPFDNDRKLQQLSGGVSLFYKY